MAKLISIRCSDYQLFMLAERVGFEPTGPFRFCKLQIPQCQRCRRCQRCRSALPAIARTAEVSIGDLDEACTPWTCPRESLGARRRGAPPRYSRAHRFADHQHARKLAGSWIIPPHLALPIIELQNRSKGPCRRARTRAAVHRASPTAGPMPSCVAVFRLRHHATPPARSVDGSGSQLKTGFGERLRRT